MTPLTGLAPAGGVLRGEKTGQPNTQLKSVTAVRASFWHQASIEFAAILAANH
jgi:hypothetical protein